MPYFNLGSRDYRNLVNRMTFDEFLQEWRSEVPEIAARTSGSTGSPKEIRLKKEFVRESALRTNSFFGIDSRSRLHSCVSPEFIGGKMMAVRAEEAGCRFSWEEPANICLQGVGKDERIDLLAVVPSQMLYIVSHLEEIPSIGNIIVGGSAINPVLRRRIAESGLNAFETYGMTETASHIALRKITAGEEWFSPLSGIRVETDDRGCLVIHFDSGEKVVTNDLARVSHEGSFLIDGRYDHIIITGGKKVNPFEVERKISRFLEIPFVVTSAADEKWGERVILRIEGRGDENDAALLNAEIRQCLAPWEVPKEIHYVEKLERTPNGKIIR